MKEVTGMKEITGAGEGYMKKYRGTSVSCRNIRINGGFWEERRRIAREAMLPAVHDRFEETGRFRALDQGWKEGEPDRPHIFWDSDVTKWIEGAAYFLQESEDEALEAEIDGLIGRMERHQEENGYLNSYFSLLEPAAKFTRRGDHELYCAGHLIEAAIAWAQATGKTNLLSVAVKYADLIDRVFCMEHSAEFDTPGHEEIELALVRLYEYTGEERYKTLAEYFIDTRGKSQKDRDQDEEGQSYMQSHLPVRLQRTAEGHAVRALYLYCGMADLALLNQDRELADACCALYDNIVSRRMQITGGVGSTHRGEAFTCDYDLPEYTSYNETCASIALAMFCRRMWLLKEDGKYADCAERAIYNTVLGGVSLSGDTFFYENPLGADPDRNQFNSQRPKNLQEHLPLLQRVKVFDCSCCPPNLLRMIGSIGDYMYSTADDTVYTQMYMSADADILLGEKKICLSQRTEYPYEGRVTLRTDTAGDYDIAIRIPGWCHGFSVWLNGALLSAQSGDSPENAGYIDRVEPLYGLRHNDDFTSCAGEEQEAAGGVYRNGFLHIRRSWISGDTLEVELDMTPELTEANAAVRNLCGRVAVMRGPVVYCAEGMDQPGIMLKDVRLERDAEFTVCREEINGIRMPVLYMRAAVREAFPQLYRPCRRDSSTHTQVRLKLIPYFAWANRGITEMNVWFLVQ